LIIVWPLLAVAELEQEQAAFFEELRNYRHHHRTDSSLAAIWLEAFPIALIGSS